MLVASAHSHINATTGSSKQLKAWQMGSENNQVQSPVLGLEGKKAEPADIACAHLQPVSTATGALVFAQRTAGLSFAGKSNAAVLACSNAKYLCSPARLLRELSSLCDQQGVCLPSQSKLEQ
jgi:hypothetical protein